MITNILVRPGARGGKYLGPDAANAQHISALVSIANPVTGDNITFGYVNTNGKDPGPSNIMDPISRAAPFPTDANTIGVNLQVDISEPTDFKVMVFGPLSFPDQARLAQADITVLPGMDIGIIGNPANALMPYYPEGLVIEVPGLCISNVAADWASKTVSCSAKVTMMCGCPINDIVPWPWPPSDFCIQLVTYMQSGALHKYTLGFNPDPNLVSSFIGEWPNQAVGKDSVVQAWIFASQPKLGNQGKYKIFPKAPLQLPANTQKMLSEAGYAG